MFVIAVFALLLTMNLLIIAVENNNYISIDLLTDKLCNSVIIFLVAAMCIMICVFKSYSYADYGNYQHFFNAAPRLGDFSNLLSEIDLFYDYNVFYGKVEIGYVFLNSLARFVVDDFSFLLLICSSISLGLCLIAYYRASSNIVLSFFIMFSGTFVVNQLIQIRSGMTAAVALVATVFFLENKKKTAIILFIVAVLLHVFSILYMLLFALAFLIKPGRRVFLISSIVVVILFFMQIGIVELFDSLMPAVSMYLKLSNYSGVGSALINSTRNIIIPFQLATFLILISVNYSRLKLVKRTEILINLYLVCALTIASIAEVDIQLRINYFSILVFSLIAPSLENTRRKKVGNLITMLTVLVFCTIDFLMTAYLLQ